MIKDTIYNRPTTRLITLNGQTKSIADWSREVGINVNTLYSRLGLLKWKLKRALTEPVKRKTA